MTNIAIYHTVIRLGGSSLPGVRCMYRPYTNCKLQWLMTDGKHNNFAAHTFVLSKQSSIRDSVDAAYHMRIYQVKNT